MHRTPVLYTALIICMVLAGCSPETREDGAPEPETATADSQSSLSTVVSPTPDPAEPSKSEPSPSFENAWAEKQLQDYMMYQGTNSLEGFSKGSPERNIVAVTNPEDGVVRFEVRDLNYEADGWALEGLAVNFMLYTGCAAEEVDAVIVETAGGGKTVTQDRCH